MFNDLLGEIEEKPTLHDIVKEKFENARPKTNGIKGKAIKPEDIQKYINKIFGDGE